MKGKDIIGRIVGWSTWHFLDPSQVEEGQSRHSSRTVWVRIVDLDDRHFFGKCIHTGQNRIGGLRDIHTVMPAHYSR